MGNHSSFLDLTNLEEFKTENRRIIRNIVRVAGFPPQPIPTHEQTEQPLASTIAGRIRHHQDERKPGKWFECCCITVQRDDGLSWSAEAVLSRLHKDFEHFKLVALPTRHDTGNARQIRELVGHKQLMKAARRHKLIESHASRKVRTFILTTIAAIIGGLVVLANLSSTPVATFLKPKLPGLEHNPMVVIIVILAALALVALKVLNDPKVDDDPSKSGSAEEKLWKELEEQEKRGWRVPGPYNKFIIELAQHLATANQPRVVIVDDFERIDPTSQAVIEQYFDHDVKQSGCSELWIIFEREDGASFKSMAARRYNSSDKQSAYANTRYYTQSRLTQKQRSELAKIVGKPENAQFATVKTICEGNAKTRAHIRAVLTQFREEHPLSSQGYDALDLLNLLAATARVGDIDFTARELKQRFAKSTQLRAPILSQILHGATLIKSEIESTFDAMSQYFPLLLSQEGREQNLKVQPFVETALELAEDKVIVDLKLPSPGLTHLFWCFFWYDRMLNGAYRAFFLRKLVYHLEKADVNKFSNPQDRPALRNQLFDIAMYTCEGLRQTCIFKQGEIGKALKKAADLYGDATDDEKKAWTGRLMQSYWEAYSVLGQDSLLDPIISVFENESIQEHALAPSEPDNNPGALFFAALGLTPKGREALLREFSPQTAAQRGYQAAAQDYADARATWLSVSISPLLFIQPVKTKVLLQSSTLASSQHLSELLDRCCKRIERMTEAKSIEAKADSKHLPAIDVASVSLSLWSLSLLLCEHYEEPLKEHWDRLTSMAESALVVADDLRKKTLGTTLDVLIVSLAQELSAIAIGSLLMAYQFVSGQEGVDITVLQGQLRLAERAIGPVPGVPEPAPNAQLDIPALIEKVDAILAMCAFVWKQLGLEEMETCAHIRRFQFNYMCDRLELGKLQDGSELMDIAQARNLRAGYTTILANCVAASCHRDSRELIALFIREAANAAAQTLCSAQLKREMALLALYSSQSYGGFTSAPFLKTLLEDDEEGSYLYNAMSGMSEPEFELCVWVFLDAAYVSNDDHLIQQIRQLFTELMHQKPDGQVRLELEGQLEYRSLRWTTYNGGTLPPAEELLAQWTGRTGTRAYLAVLRLLLETSANSDQLRALALSKLETFDPSDNSEFLLALTLSDMIPRADQAALQTVVACLEHEIDRWEPAQDAKLNQTALRFLSKQGSDFASPARLSKWENIIIERDHLLRLRSYIDQHEYLFLVLYYVQWALHWSLPLDISNGDWWDLIEADQATRSRLLTDWKDSGRQVPDPMSYSNREYRMSSSFLSIGKFLFLSPADKEKSWDQDRTRFDQKAKEIWPALIKKILQLKDMPQDIRESLERHTAALADYDGELGKDSVFASPTRPSSPRAPVAQKVPQQQPPPEPALT